MIKEVCLRLFEEIFVFFARGGLKRSLLPRKVVSAGSVIDITLDDGINVTRIFKKVQRDIKMKRFLRFLERRNCPHKKLRKRM